MNYWKDKVAIVTGASSGLGLALATELVTQGANVILVARNQQKLTEACQTLSDKPGVAHSFAANITSDDQVASLFCYVEDNFGRLDLLVNNAGASARGRIEDTSLEEFQQMYDLNVQATIRCTQAAIHLLKKS